MIATLTGLSTTVRIASISTLDMLAGCPPHPTTV
jgi:hypothetical protein